MKNVNFRTDILPLKNVLYRLALRITMSHEDAEDIVQDTLMKVWNRRETLDSVDNIEAYTLTICRNLALDKLKRADQGNLSLDEMETYQQPAHNGTAERVVLNDRMATVRRLIDSLPEKQRSAMQLRDIEGKSYKEIAQILQITEEQVKVNIFRARQTVKQRFKETEQYGL